MLAAQSEAERISRAVSGTSLQELTRERSRNPNDRGVQAADDAKLKTLRAEFAEGMSICGVEGNPRCHGALRVAAALGIPYEYVAEEHMQDEHRRAYEAAGRYRFYESNFPRTDNIPQPTPPPRQGRNMGSYGQGRNVFVAPGKTALKAGRRRGRAW